MFCRYNIGLKLTGQGKFPIISVKFLNDFINSITRKRDMFATFFNMLFT